MKCKKVTSHFTICRTITVGCLSWGSHFGTIENYAVIYLEDICSVDSRVVIRLGLGERVYHWVRLCDVSRTVGNEPGFFLTSSLSHIYTMEPIYNSHSRETLTRHPRDL